MLRRLPAVVGPAHPANLTGRSLRAPAGGRPSPASPPGRPLALAVPRLSMAAARVAPGGGTSEGETVSGLAIAQIPPGHLRFVATQDLTPRGSQRRRRRGCSHAP